MKRFLSLALVLILCAGLIPAGAEAAGDFAAAYADFLQGYKSDSFFPDVFMLAYVDGDTTPELLIVNTGEAHADSVAMYAYTGGQVKNIGYYGQYSYASFALTRGIIESFYMGQGYYDTSFFAYGGGFALKLKNFVRYEEEWHKIDGVQVSEAEFTSQLEAMRSPYEFTLITASDGFEMSGLNFNKLRNAPDSFTLGPIVRENTPSVSQTAHPSTQKVYVDGKAVEFQMYALWDENGFPTNYIKVRDLALVLNGTAARFQVSWDGTVDLLPGQPYTPNGSEMSTPFSGDRPTVPVSSVTKVNGAVSDLSAFMLADDNGGGYTYYKLRDLGRALGFNVGWNSQAGAAYIETDKDYQG